MDFLKRLLPGRKKEEIRDFVQRRQDASNRPRQHSFILLVGKSGVGKTSTIKHLIGQNKDLVFKISDHKSETRETIEYVLTLAGKDDDVFITGNTVSLAIVDTPGINDTDGIKQDARNMACLSTFLSQHEALNEAGSNKRRIPNMILLMLNATDNRYKGPDSPLERSLRLMASPEMQLTDGTNLVVVVTHANSISAEEWKQKTTDISKVIKDTVRTITKHGKHHNVPVVFIDNKVEPRQKVPNGWSLLNDKTIQPRNLFAAISAVLMENGDTVAHCAVSSFFGQDGRQKKLASTESKPVMASLEKPPDKAKKEPMTKLEKKLLKVLKKDQDSDDDEEPEEQEEQEEEETSACSDESNDDFYQNGEDQTTVQTIVENIIKENKPYGTCYDLKKKEMMNTSAFIKTARALTASNIVTAQDQRESITSSNIEEFESKWRMGADLKVDQVATASSHINNNGNSSRHNSDMALEEFTVAKITYPEQDVRKTDFNPRMVNELKSLDLFDPCNDKSKNKFKSFFKKNGAMVLC